MKKLIVVVVLAGLAWAGYQKYQVRANETVAAATSIAPPAEPGPTPAATAAFKCDGRTKCSQMTSCAEATYFIQHCPATTMDGNNDGVPCERQWCEPTQD